MKSKLVLILSGVAAIVLALIINPMKFPKDEISKTILLLFHLLNSLWSRNSQ